MREPAFWSNDPETPGWQARLLSPLGAVYGAVTGRRVARAPDISPMVPVVCIGNINAGGTGKTPTTIALIELLRDKGVDVQVVSRGYGGRLDGPVLVDPKTHQAGDVGDEPLLLAAFSTVWISKDRAAGVRAAQDAGAQVILMDDGFQNPSVAKSLSIVVVDANQGFGNGRCIPAGPLREPVAKGLDRADLLLSIGDDVAQHAFADKWRADITVPHITARLDPLETGMDWGDMRALAFAGIGHPEKFFRSLRGLGVNLLHTEALSDHQPLTSSLMARLSSDAARLGAQLVTTEKDAVRLPTSFRSKVVTLPVRLRFNDPAALHNALEPLLSRQAEHPESS